MRIKTTILVPMFAFILVSCGSPRATETSSPPVNTIPTLAPTSTAASLPTNTPQPTPAPTAIPESLEEESEETATGGSDATPQLVSEGFLINLMDEPAGTRIVGFQERGVRVTLLDCVLYGDEYWFRVEAPVGEGWVEEENLTIDPDSFDCRELPLPTAVPTEVSGAPPVVEPVPPPRTREPVVVPAPETIPNWTTFVGANAVTDLAFDHDGDLWAATTGGVVRWHPTDNTFVHYTTADGLASNDIDSVAVSPDNTVWVISSGRTLSRFSGTASPAENGARWINYDVFSTGVRGLIYALAFSADGALWMGDSFGRLYRFEQEIWFEYGELSSREINCILPTPDGALWLGTGAGAIYFDGDSIVTYTRDHGLVDNRVTAIGLTPDGALWFGTDGGGVSRFLAPAATGDGDVWTSYTSSDGLVSDSISAIAVPPDGALWLGTDGGGVSRLAGSAGGGEQWTSYTTEDGLANDLVTDIEVGPNGALWLGTRDDPFSMLRPSGGAISRFTGPAGSPGGETWTTFVANDGPYENYIVSLAESGAGILYAGTWSRGLSIYDGRAWTDLPVFDHISAIAITSNEELWFGTMRYGIHRFTTETAFSYSTADGLGSNAIMDIAGAPDGSVWVATSALAGQGGIAHFTGGAEGDRGTWTTYTTADGLAGNHVHTIAVTPDGAVWCATDRGISHYDGREWQELLTPDDVATENVHSIVVAPDGAVWFGTRRGSSDDGWGVLRLDGETWTQYTIDDGLAGDVVTAIAVAPDGTLWFASYGAGLSRFDGTTWLTYTAEDNLPSVHITALVFTPDGSLWVGTEGDGIGLFSPPD